MTTVIINATICDGTNEFISAIEELCAQRSMDLSITMQGSDTCIMLVNKMPTATAITTDEPQMPVQSLTQEPQLPNETSTIPDIANMVDVEDENNECPVGEISREAIVLSLTTQCAIPVKCDDSLTFSKLCVSNVEQVGDHIFFEYCGNTFKFPLLSFNSISDAINIEAAVNNTLDRCIRIVIQYTDTLTTHAVAVQVCEKTPEDSYHIIFGHDLYNLFTA